MAIETSNSKIDISVAELMFALPGPVERFRSLLRIVLQVTARKKEWGYFKKVFNRGSMLKEFMDEEDTVESLTVLANQYDLRDLIVPDDLARAIYLELDLYAYILRSGHVIIAPTDRAIEKISLLDLYIKYGGGFLEGLFEKGSMDPKDPTHYKSERQRRGGQV